ncbi:MAG TPA: tripartite tricarboxylate transporter substrate binding protein [Beijerinckiaceae bacterium]|jgi:tripartite-type tricarboxylate transporter receptor subunit TctC|nr:tripartite tricarboxylate transporter substrate binding protein [Beijerinckiaceae bacterium]
MKRILGASALALAALTQLSTVHASDTYPDRPIRWVVPYPAGAPTDTVARKLADVMSKKTGWKIYIENKTGAAGTIGAADVARSPGDGYSFLVSTGDALVSNAVSMKSVTYDPKKDFALVSQIGSAGYVMLVGPQLGVNTLSELIAKVRSTPAGWNVGVTGPASPQNLITRALAKKTGISLNTVPYQGSAPAVQDVLSGNVEITYTGAILAAPFVETKKLVAIATNGPNRSALLPDVPTFAELGYADPVFLAPTWLGMAAPAKTPQNIIEQTARSVREAMADPELNAFVKGQGFDVIANTPEEFRAAFEREFETIPLLIKDALGTN